MSLLFPFLDFHVVYETMLSVQKHQYERKVQMLTAERDRHKAMAEFYQEKVVYLERELENARKMAVTVGPMQ